ncbi:hypothetical protein EYB26_000073 [Talaromyces marneffei]|uniref:uncharacterized protein n=1 Tax=Talaromyces marneffei TaxID=37727 RepID=UPI0012A8CE22|nr:uncharacterized protein EYB26_000073 [Talaromyces marneffei]QGA12429.1 hypothetical protein EYB26_000073 [Talaromyces marneffei]
MAVTLKNIKFYNPHSLPTRPSKRTSPNHNHTSIPRSASKSTDPTPNHSTVPFSPFSQPALPHPLPPRPPAIFPSSHHTASVTPYVPSSISHTPDPHPVYKNDFDQASDEFLSSKNGKKEDENSSSLLPTQDHGNGNHSHTALPDPEILAQTTASLQSSSWSLPKPVESPVEAKPTHPKPRDESQPREQPNDLACITSMETSPTFCTSEPHTSAPHEPNHDSTHTAIQGSARDSCVPNQERSETSGTSSAPIHSPEREVHQHTCLIRPLRWLWSQICHVLFYFGDPHESDSAPSDDENDADYLDHSETDASESLHPSKRRRRRPCDASSASQGAPKKLSSESPLAGQPESLPENSSPESESIPIQGFLRLRTKGTEVIYSLEFSQTHFSSFFADNQMKSPRPHSRTAYPTTKNPYSPEEDAFIIDLKARNLSWDEIEDQFAERFLYRKKSSLQVRYSTKLKHLKK